MIAEFPTRSTYSLPYSSAEYPQGFLSPTSIVDFLRCGTCFYLARIEKMPHPRSIHLPMGNAVHAALNQARNAALIDQFDLEQAEAAAADTFERAITQPVDEETGEEEEILEIDLKKYANLGKAKDHAMALVAYAVPVLLKLDATRGKVAATEYELSAMASPYPFPIVGRMDALYVDWLEAPEPQNAHIMADTKTAAKLAPPDEYTALAQTVYEEHFHALHKPLVVIADVISKRIAKGRYLPELQSFPLLVNEWSRELAHRTVLEVAEDISAGRFRPRPNFLCSYVHGFPEFQVAVSGFAEEEVAE